MVWFKQWFWARNAGFSCVLPIHFLDSHFTTIIKASSYQPLPCHWTGSITWPLHCAGPSPDRLSKIPIFAGHWSRMFDLSDRTTTLWYGDGSTTKLRLNKGVDQQQIWNAIQAKRDCSRTLDFPTWTKWSKCNNRIARETNSGGVQVFLAVVLETSTSRTNTVLDRIGNQVYSTWVAATYIPRCSTYGIFTYIWVIFWVNVGNKSIHGEFGILMSLYNNHLLVVERLLPNKCSSVGVHLSTSFWMNTKDQIFKTNGKNS